MASVTAIDRQTAITPKLKLAFCLYKYFPHGGLQRDFLRIALACQQLGHDIRVYTLTWRGDIPEGFSVTIVPIEALTNHTRYERFNVWLLDALVKDPVDAVVGINKMPGLDVYYAADSCYKEKAYTQRSWLYRQLPRYRHFSRFENAVFGQASSTEILMISSVQKPFFDRYYQTQPTRMHFLPPGISRDRIAPANVAELRSSTRAELGIADDERMLLMLGSGFVKKGLKRALFAVRALPAEARKKTRFFVIGEDNPAPFLRLIWLLGLQKQVTILPGRDDVPNMLFAADLLILPALDEAAGIVLLESIVAGLPILATDNCGYAHYITESQMGQLVPSPFKQSVLNEKLQEMLLDTDRQKWIEAGQYFSRTADIYSLHQEAARYIQAVACRKKENPDCVVAFCLFKYFPYGGLQRDFLRIAESTQQRGYKIRVYTLEWQGEFPPGFEVVIVPVHSLTNHTRYRLFHTWVKKHLSSHPVVRVVGFNKMPGLDIYYAADSCYEEKAQKQRSWLYRRLPRYALFSGFEAAVFGKDSTTEVLMISPVQVPLFEKYYATGKDRFHVLSPGIGRDRVAPDNKLEVRAAFREEFGLNDDDFLLLMIGSGFITKGLDRALIGLAALRGELRDKTRLLVIGQDAPGAFKRMATRLGIKEQVEILKGRDDIPRFLMGADLLVHPAYVENTGTVLLEAIVAGLPVLATDVCGYSHYISEAGAGLLIPSPFQQETMNIMLENMMTSEDRTSWSNNGLAYAEVADIYDMPEHAADFIVEQLVAAGK